MTSVSGLTMSAFSIVPEDSGWWREVSGVLVQRFDASEERKDCSAGLTNPAPNQPRIRPESKLQDKCCERTAALDVENTMCRVNRMGSNAGAWDAADGGGALSDVLGLPV
ncbi:hypothetical protein DFH08DRAFT_975933 [Mycena albidolilacea]|uniref:Uncharacterized protein n=1 Tax=Mycena albidolilacea TaxID=1033008 RepID=A0AAD6Z440_9AGAR|nr:hypothetical protein DFH08DRAFT_975933 [Mycena albidolilacea]